MLFSRSSTSLLTLLSPSSGVPEDMGNGGLLSVLNCSFLFSFIFFLCSNMGLPLGAATPRHIHPLHHGVLHVIFSTMASSTNCKGIFDVVSGILCFFSGHSVHGHAYLTCFPSFFTDYVAFWPFLKMFSQRHHQLGWCPVSSAVSCDGSFGTS